MFGIYEIYNKCVANNYFSQKPLQTMALFFYCLLINNNINISKFCEYYSLNDFHKRENE